MTCTVTDCDVAAVARGMCQNHYRRARKYGDPLVVKKPGRPCVDAATRGEDIEWLAETGECASGAAQRLGLTYDALEKWASKHTPAAWQRLLAREPRDHNRNRHTDDGLTGLYKYTDRGRTRAARRQAQKGNAA